MSATGRNAPCPCGSGRKFKHCCLGKDRDWSLRQKVFLGAGALALVIAVAAIVTTTLKEADGRPGMVWSAEHQHWHEAP